MPLASTKVLPFGVSAVFSSCAEAADDARMKVKAAIAANVLDVAALLLMRRVERRRCVAKTNAEPRELFRPNYSAEVSSFAKTASPQSYFLKRA